MTTRVLARLDRRLQRNVDHPLALALSGGGDSLALLEIAAAWSRRSGRSLVAITVDHGLNPDAPAWSRVCERAARSVGADWIERRWADDKPATGLPAAARRARHALIAEAARKAGARVVLFAHTADDVDEAEWMRDRGSTLGRLRDWSPSPAWPEGRGLMLLRPMLEERRDDLRAFLRERGRDWIEDPANTGFARGRARRALAENAAREPSGGAGPETAVASPRQEAIGRPNAGWSPLPLGAGFSGGGDLALALLCAAGHDRLPRGDRLAALRDRLRRERPFTATLAGTRIEATAERVLLLREVGEFRRRPAPHAILRPGRAAVWDGRYEITAAEPGWTVTAALGRLNALSPADRAVMSELPPAARPSLPVLIRDDATAPVLAWRHAEVRALAPRRLSLARWACLGETTQESDLARTIHGETPPPDLF